MMCSMVMIDNTPGPGYEAGVTGWLGDDLSLVKDSISDFKERMQTRKAIGNSAKYLAEQLQLDSQSELPVKLTPEEIGNYETRVNEAKSMSIVGLDEVNRGFSIAKLFLSFLLMKKGKSILTEDDKRALVSEATKEITSPMPVPTPSLRATEFVRPTLIEIEESLKE